MNIHFEKYVLSIVLGFVLLFSMWITIAIVEASPPEPVKLKVLLLPYLSFAPFFIAEEEGYFAEQGLEVEFVKVSKSGETIPALAQGDLDVVAGIVGIGWMNAIDRGGSLKLVADKGYITSAAGCPDNVLLARRDLVEAGELSNPAQLRGRRIILEPASIDGYFTEKVLKTANLTLDDVSAEHVPPSVRLEGLKTGAIDLVQATEPWIVRILQAGDAVVWVAAKDVIPEFQYAAVFYGPNLLDKNPEVGQRFMVAYLKAVRQYNQGKSARNLEILAKHTGLERELLQEGCWPAIRNDGYINVDSVLEFQTWALEKGWLNKVVPAEQFWDHRFIEYANQVLGIPSK